MKFYKVGLCALIFICGACDYSVKVDDKKNTHSCVNKKKLSGKYNNTGRGLYRSFEFRGNETCIVHGMGMEYVTTYKWDGDLLRVKTDKSDLLFTQQENNVLVGEGYAKGIYELNFIENTYKKEADVKSSFEKPKSTDEAKRKINEAFERSSGKGNKKLIQENI